MLIYTIKTHQYKFLGKFLPTGPLLQCEHLRQVLDISNDAVIMDQYKVLGKFHLRISCSSVHTNLKDRPLPDQENSTPVHPFPAPMSTLI